MGTGAVAERLRAGDRAAFAEMYNEFAEPLLGLCIVLLRDRGDAEDAMHDAFILAAQRIDQLRDPERLRPWLFAIARHVCFRRIAQRRRTVPVATVPDIDLTQDDPTDRLAAVEAAELMWAAASGLNDRDRAALYLNTSQGLEGEMLTAALGVRHVNPHSVLNRAKRQLDRSIGVLLVARSGREDCTALDGVLEDWDGTLSPLLRKRVGRHVDNCEICRSTRVRAIATSSIAGITALATQTAAALPGILTADELFDIASRRPLSTERWQRDGFPPPDDPDPRRRRRRLIGAWLFFGIIGAFGLFTYFHVDRTARKPSPRELESAALVLPVPTSAPRNATAPVPTTLRPRPTTTVTTVPTRPPGTLPGRARTVETPVTAPAPPPTQPVAAPVTTTPVTVAPTPVTVKLTVTPTTAPRTTPTTAAPPPPTTPTTIAPPNN